MKRVGITGGMGCGKTTVVAAFRRLGVACFVADEVASDYYNRQEFIEQLTGLFGDNIFSTDGRVDKRKLAAIVFSDAAKLAQLNKLVHPMVMADFERFCIRHQDDAYVLFESAVLYESGLWEKMDKMVCVYLDMNERMARLRERDHANDHQIMARIAAQLPAEYSLCKADYVILNYEGNPRERQVAYVDKMLRR